MGNISCRKCHSENVTIENGRISCHNGLCFFSEDICNHENGWVLKEDVVIDSKLDNNNFECEFECNNIGCGERRKFKFDIMILG